MDIEISTTETLAYLINAGLDELDQIHEADQQRAEQAAAERHKGWRDYENACRRALPEVLKPYMLKFAVPNRDADWNKDAVVTVQIPGLTEMWARVIDPQSSKPRQPGRSYSIAAVKAYIIPYPAIRFVGKKMVAKWEYRNTSYIYGRDQLALALAQAQIQIENWDRLVEEIAAEEAAAELEMRQVTYQPIEGMINPNPEIQVIDVIKGWIDSYVSKKLAAQKS